VQRGEESAFGLLHAMPGFGVVAGFLNAVDELAAVIGIRSRECGRETVGSGGSTGSRASLVRSVAAPIS